MKPETTEDILEILDGYILSAAVGAAMELGVFWSLAERPLPAAAVAESLAIPLNRCHAWLELLCQAGLLAKGGAGYAPTLLARRTILDAQSRHFWAFHAREDRRATLRVRDLAVNLGKPVSAWAAPEPAAGDETEWIREDPGYAAAFTRMLYEIHLALAEEVADLLDVQGVKRVMDLGGGSGVVSFALLRKEPGLSSVVVDVEYVCRAGRDIARENGLAARIGYLPADFLHDELPSGFDLALLCDVGIYGDSLLQKIHDALAVNGRLVVVDKFAATDTDPPPSRLAGALLAALDHPAESIGFLTAQSAQARLQAAGFRDVVATLVPRKDDLRWNRDWTMMEARK